MEGQGGFWVMGRISGKEHLETDIGYGQGGARGKEKVGEGFGTRWRPSFMWA